MKIFTTILKSIVLFVFVLNISLYAEIEPNNSYQQANTIGLNSADSGALNEATQTQAADNYDWWKVTLPFDGRLYFETNSGTGLDIDLTIYDTNGSSYLGYGSTRSSSKETVVINNLIAGTYYVLASRYTGTGTYSIISEFIQTSLANDTEPNDTYSQGITLLPNSTTTGHLGFFNYDKTDSYDFWKVVLADDGVLAIETTSDATLDIDLTIYDTNGSSYLTYGSTRGSTVETASTHLLAGTYYVLAQGWTGYGSYTIKSVFTPANLAIETEPNDTYSQAINLDPNSTDTGHLGFFNYDKTDIYDFWKVVLTDDGVLAIETTSDVTLDIDLTIYDTNGSSYLTYGSTRGSTVETASTHLLAGTYYVLAQEWTGYGSYTIKSVFTPANLANDTEPNDVYSQGITLLPNSISTGHLGFFNYDKTDSYDYYSFTLPSDWDSLYVRTDSDPTLDIDLTLYDSPSTYVAYGSSRSSTREMLGYKNALASHTYYISVADYSGYGSYAIKISNTYPKDPLTDVKKEELEIIPTVYSLSQNYPNPFNPSTTIKYDIPQTSNVSLKVYDVLGNEVVTLVNENQTAGSYSVNFTPQNLSSGIYFYRINAGNFSVVKKFILMK